jgi:hypothetical protein
MILWIISIIYWLPGWIFLAVFSMSALARSAFLLRWVFEKVTGSAMTMSLEEIFTAIGLAGVAELAIPFLYFMLAYPVYRAGMVRFALTQRVGAFFEVVANVRLAITHVRDFMLLFFIDWGMVKMGIGLLSLFLTFIGLAPILVPALVLPFYYWTTGYLYGVLAGRLRTEIGRSRGLEQGTAAY